ncbi:hypothetical protein HF885_10110 [Olsenella umbonata]|uniref:Uncharacterized protein n=1 Tax=Parafannyhessea umbonata TaxID=604330 RepID=A0A7X9TC70_9ACTN|nr:hypothetical protein [Parafannyhessea umbonata]NMF26762.1 hypothetical protein [Parafannyhessea umbonata]
MDSKGSCIAQDLADRLGVTVTAPNGTIYVNPDGTFYVGRHGNGSMVAFVPSGERR